MTKIKSMLLMLLVAGLLTGSSFMMGCGGGVDEEQLQALNSLKAEVESLQGQVKAKEDEKASLQKKISDQEAKNKKCTEDLAKVKNCVDDMSKEGK
jgi:septal ring factor EnvC (AmiA/AmiB activator)